MPPPSDAAIPRINPTPNGAFCSPSQRRFVLVAAILASALGFIDGSILAIAMPAIRVDLGASLAQAQWISNAYALTLSALILAGGAAGDRFGLRRAFVAGIALFVVSSLACAMAPGPGVLIAFRAIQGIGAAIMVPGSLAIIAKAYPKKERGRAIGIWAAASALTTALGPVLGGFVLSTFGNGVWRAIFAINLPLGLISIYLLLALGGAREEGLRAEFEKLFGDILERHPETTGIVAGSKRQEEALWRLREDTDVIYRAHAAAPSYDVSVPLSQIDGYVETILTGLAAIDPELKPFVFGHLADGNPYDAYLPPDPDDPAGFLTAEQCRGTA